MSDAGIDGRPPTTAAAESLYFVDLIFAVRRAVRSLPPFHGARFSAYLRHACRQAGYDFPACCAALLPFRSGTRPLLPGERLRLRLQLSAVGVRALPDWCRALRLVRPDGEFSATSLALIRLHDPLGDQSWDPGSAPVTPLSPFTSDAVAREAAYLQAVTRFTLEFYTPLRLGLPAGTRPPGTGDGIDSLCGPEFLTHCPYLLAYLLDSLRRLPPLSVTSAELSALPSAVAAVGEWCELRYNARRRIPLGGLLGTVTYDGPLPGAAIAARLAAGQYVGLGRAQKFGLGFYRLSVPAALRPMPLPTAADATGNPSVDRRRQIPGTEQ